MCVGGGNSPPPLKSGTPEHDEYMKEQGYWSEGTLGGSGTHGGGDRHNSYWKSNPTWDQQWYDKGYKKGDWVSTRENQSDRTT